MVGDLSMFRGSSCRPRAGRRRSDAHAMVALTASQVVEDLVRAAGRWRLSPACPGRRPSPGVPMTVLRARSTRPTRHLLPADRRGSRALAPSQQAVAAAPGRGPQRLHHQRGSTDPRRARAGPPRLLATAGSVTLRHRPQMLCTHRFPNPEHDRSLPTDAWIIVGECGSLLRSWR